MLFQGPPDAFFRIWGVPLVLRSVASLGNNGFLHEHRESQHPFLPMKPLCNKNIGQGTNIGLISTILRRGTKKNAPVYENDNKN